MGQNAGTYLRSRRLSECSKGPLPGLPFGRCCGLQSRAPDVKRVLLTGARRYG
jgi:hypothetical protein